MNIDKLILDQDQEITKFVQTTDQKIHIRIKPRNGKKCDTIIENLPPTLDMPVTLSKLKKICSCNGAISSNAEGQKFVLLFGDQREQVRQYLIKNSIATDTNIIKHGY